jgi:hypothetical protein
MADTDDFYPLIELEIEEPELFGPAPQRFGFTTRPQSFTTVDAQGGAHTFLPGLLSVDVPARRADFYSGASASESAPSFSVALEAFPAVDFWAMRIRFEWIQVRIWWWRPGWTLAEAVQVWVGRLRDPVIEPGSAADGRAGTFSASAPPGTTEIDVDFPPGFIGDEGRFPSAPESSLPVPLPIIIGTPRNVPIYAIEDDSVDFSPPAPAASIRYLVAAHPIASETLTIRSDGANGFIKAGESVLEDIDGRGNRYSYVELDNTDAGWGPGLALYAGDGTTGVVDGQIGPEGTAIKGLGDVLIYMLHTFAREQFFEIDRDRIYAARAKLNAFRVGSWFNNRTDGESLLRILKTRYEGQFPVSFNFANGRFGWDYTGVPEAGTAAVASIVWGQNAHDRGPLQNVSIELLRTRFEIQYQRDGYAAGTVGSVRRGPENSAKARACLTKWRINREAVISAPDCADEYTARLLAEDQINRLTVLRSRIEYVVDEPRLATLPLFARVVVTDATWGWVNEPFLVEGVALLQPGRVSLALITENGR